MLEVLVIFFPKRLIEQSEQKQIEDRQETYCMVFLLLLFLDIINIHFSLMTKISGKHAFIEALSADGSCLI